MNFANSSTPQILHTYPYIYFDVHRPPYMAASMCELKDNILTRPLKPLPEHYSKDLKQLIYDLLTISHVDRPTVQDLPNKQPLKSKRAEYNLVQQYFIHCNCSLF